MANNYIGEPISGGVLFHIYTTTGGTQGLIVSPTDVDNGIVWSNVLFNLVGNTTDWDGESNTRLILDQQGHIESASLKCTQYLDGGWFLPSATQLKLIDRSIWEINHTLSTIPNSSPVLISHYWSSTEYVDRYACMYNFETSKISFDGIKKDNRFRVRAVKTIQL